MKNITVTVDDEVYRKARVRAAEADTSVSALVRDFLIGIAGGETPAQTLRREEAALRDKIRAFKASDRLSRDEVHGRKA